MNNFRDIIRSLPPEVIERYLSRLGYSRLPGPSELGVLVEGEDNTVLVIPQNRGSREYERRVVDIAEHCAGEDLNEFDVIAMMHLPPADLFRFRIDSEGMSHGLLNLAYSQRAVRSLFDVIRFSAAGVSTRLRDYRNLSEEAKQYAASCRLGQTEIGSYVIKIYCPVNPHSISIPDFEPFGRRAMHAVMENFQFVTDERSEDPREPLPTGMNQQVLSAIENLRPASDFSDTEVRVRYEATTIQSQNGAETLRAASVESLKISPFAFSRAAAVRRRLVKAEQEGRDVVSGYITDLHKDNPTLDDVERRVSISVRYEGVDRKVTCRLAPGDYRQAIQWHDEGVKVRLDALFDKRERPWSVLRLFSLGPKAPEASLFDGLSK